MIKTKPKPKLPETMSLQVWNDIWFARVEPIPYSGNDRLMVGQVMSGYVKYDGKKYRVVGWAVPGSKPYVVTKLVIDEI